MSPLNNCENDLTGADFEELDPNVSSGVLSRSSGISSSISLFNYIDQTKSYTLNTTPPSPSGIKRIVRPHHTRNSNSLDESISSVEDTDNQILIHLVFSELVKVKSILINIGRGDESPGLVKVWKNRFGGLGFSDVDEVQVDQEWELNQSDEAIEYSTRVSRFQSVSSLTFEFKDSSGGDKSRIFFLGILGEVKQLKKDQSNQLGVGAENSADASIDSLKEQYGNSQTTIR